MIPLLPGAAGLLRRHGLYLFGMAAVTLLLILAFVWADEFAARFLIAERKAKAAVTAVSLASTISNAVNERLALVRGLTVFADVETGAGLLDDRFTAFAEGLRRSVPGVRAISAAPRFVIAQVHPPEGNGALLGNDLLSDPRPGFAETVQRALVSGDVAVHGPMDLVQGGRGLVARQIVFGPDRPWGAVGMAFDLQPILDDARLDTLPADLSFLLRAENGVVVAGDVATLRNAPITERITLTDGTWEFSLAPKVGWLAAARADHAYAAFVAAFVLLALMTGALAHLMLSRRATLERLVVHRTRELDGVNRELERFAYVTAHDLQEPLRAIASYTQLLERHLKGRLDEDGAEFVRQIVDGAVRLKMLLRDVQLFLAEDRVPLKIEPLPLDSVVQATLASLGPRIRETGATVTVETAPAGTAAGSGMATVMADERRLREILAVLLGNAVEYRHPYRAAEITVAHRRLGNQDAVEVRDNGIGIEPQYREQIFEVFRRLHSREAHPGTGMGLAIARKMAERMGGRIAVESSPGIGSTFTLLLPTSRLRGQP